MPQTKNEKKTTLIDRIIYYHMVALIIMLPLVFWLGTDSVFTLPKLLVFRTISLSIGFFILLKFFIHREIKLLVFKRQCPYCLLILSLILSTIFTLNLHSSLFGQYGRYMGLYTFLNLAIIPLYITSFIPKFQFRKIINISIYTAFAVAIFGLLQYLDFFGLWPQSNLWSDAPQNRVFSTIGHSNHLGAYLATHFILLAYSIKPFSTKRPALIGQFMMLFTMAVAIILTASRGAFLALALTALILSLINFRKHFVTILKNFKKIFLLSVAVTFLIGASMYFFSENLGDLSMVKRTVKTIETTEKGIIPNRLSFLYSSWDMFLDHFWTGTGLSTFRDAYPLYRRPDFIIDGPGHLEFITVPESAHNEYINLLATQGIIGFWAFVILLFFLLQIAYKKYQNAAADKDNWYLMLLGGTLVFAFQVLFNFGDLVNWFFFFVLAGMIIGEQDKPFEMTVRLPMVAFIPLITFVTYLLFLGFKQGVINEWQANYYLEKADYAANEGRYDTAINYMEMVEEARPNEYSIQQRFADILYESSLNTNGDEEKRLILQEAIKHYGEAIKNNSNYPSTFYNMGLVYLNLYHLYPEKYYLDLAMDSFLLSMEKDPQNPLYIYEYAKKLHAELNEREEAVRLLRQAASLSDDYQEPRDYLQFLYLNHPELETLE